MKFFDGMTDEIKENFLFQVFECNNLNLMARLFGVVSHDDFYMGNVGFSTGDMQKRLYGEVYISSPLFTSRYPNLAVIAAQADSKIASRNVALLYVSFFSVSNNKRNELHGDSNFITDEDPGFVSADDLDFRLLDDAAGFRAVPGFQRIPFESIGLFSDK